MESHQYVVRRMRHINHHRPTNPVVTAAQNRASAATNSQTETPPSPFAATKVAVAFPLVAFSKPSGQMRATNPGGFTPLSQVTGAILQARLAFRSPNQLRY